MKYEIKGGNLPYVTCVLQKDEKVYSETGGMAWMSSGIHMETNGKGGGIGSFIGRAFSGESLFLNTYTATEDGQEISFTSEFPGQIIDFNLQGGEIIAQKDAFMFAQDSIKLETIFTKKLGVGLFGGEGFVLQKLSGTGLLFLEIAGSVEKKELKDGEILLVDTGYVAAYESSIQSDIQMVKGFKNMMFGGEGLFIAKLIGPGKVWLQSMPVNELAKKLFKYMPTRK